MPVLKTLPATCGRRAQYLEFAMNGGMYEADLTSVGLLVIDGVERKPIDRDKGWGNFYLKPNGVFFLRGDRAGVMETEAYVAAATKPDFATQSGPMLVIDGALHPAFLPQSDSLQIRNGVGVAQDGKAVFAISLEPVRFHDFATLFRDRLGCANALFLDGSISSLFRAHPEPLRQYPSDGADHCRDEKGARLRKNNLRIAQRIGPRGTSQ